MNKTASEENLNFKTKNNLNNIRLILKNNKIVFWNKSKIHNSINKIFLKFNEDPKNIVIIIESIQNKIESLNQSFIHIENVEDILKKILKNIGYLEMSKKCTIFEEYNLNKDINLELKFQKNLIVIKSDSPKNNYEYNFIDLKKRINFALIGLNLNLHHEEIEKELLRSLYSEISLKDLRKTIILNSKSLIERDADFAKFSGRILLSYIYEEVLGWDPIKDAPSSLQNLHYKCFKGYIQYGVSIGRLSNKLLDYNLETLSQALDYSSDLNFDYLSIQTLYDRYLIVDKTNNVQKRLETPQFFWMRVAMGFFINEKNNKEALVIDLYRLYKNRSFCSSTPALFNSGTNHSQLSSCYLYKVDDSIESIMIRGIAENAYLSKWAGGLGGSWTAVRGAGSYIKGTNGESQGVIPFLKLHNDQLVAVNQGGKRRGSGVAYLEPWHNDFMDFLELRKNTGDDRRRTHDMNTATWIPDLFMKRMESRQNWTFFHSNETPELHELYGKKFEDKYIAYEKLAEKGKIKSSQIPAIDLWKKMLSMLFETGHPWITFKDPCNIRSPQDHYGVIHSSNLCTEITLNTDAEETAVCNLGSIVLDSHINQEGKLDHKKLRSTIRTAIRVLDNVIDINFYPTEAARCSNKRHRPVGLGVMGLQNALYKLGFSFASEEAIEFNDEFMEAIAYYSIEASCDLAKERGTYSSYRNSKWDRGLFPQDTIDLLEIDRGIKIDVTRSCKMDWNIIREKVKKHGMRNSNLIAIAPTATISNIMCTSACIEPNYKNLYVKSNLSGDFIILNSDLVKDLKLIGIWNQIMIEKLKDFDGELKEIKEIPEWIKQKYLTAFEIDYKYIIKAAARRQKWIDQSQSINLFLAEPSLKILSHMYRTAWHCGLKTTYYLRTMGASDIEKVTIKSKKIQRSLIIDTNDQVIKKEKCNLEEEICEACQ